MNTNQVRHFRQQKGWSQQELAQQVEVARQTINLIENNRYNPTLSLCLKLAWALETDLNALFWQQETDDEHKEML
ncbi:helix-turn-helix transcriptional regulator [Neisseriaceae bacterium CCUG 44465]|nr:helix-turn-helix transcriptional regulator [Wielerella bovis]MCG7657749.1 helix-turn-helix transcriptional regulator [Wielerella bovis]MCG7659970.1 helix-turn-helix transcriptional regulator [Wielerella bovis]ULJ61448.1 helix-turn-helix transcriptional regulator [Wielerella bovis]ULJ70408.1 helix-turn-helix transcriptional regulator [Wielerella bovis]